MSPSSDKVKSIIEKLNLQPHPEGGFYREVYRSEMSVIPQATDHGGNRSALTSIFFLLEEGDFSAWHSVRSDEVWNIILGGPLELHEISEDGEHEVAVLSASIEGSFNPQKIVLPNRLQAARVVEGGGFALCSCLVAPGFDFKDFEMPTRQTLLDQFPNLKAIITELTRN